MKRSTKDQLLINKQESRVLQHLNDSRTFIRFSNDIDDIYKSTEGYISSKNRKILNSFDDVIADIFSNKKANPRVT